MFDEVRFDFEINDRVIRMEKVVLRSPLLKLVGEGTLDMEGRLDHRLEVHYSIVDKITPYKLWEELVEHKNVALAIVVGAMCISIGNIVAAAIHG